MVAAATMTTFASRNLLQDAVQLVSSCPFHMHLSLCLSWVDLSLPVAARTSSGQMDHSDPVLEAASNGTLLNVSKRGSPDGSTSIPTSILSSIIYLFQGLSQTELATFSTRYA